MLNWPHDFGPMAWQHPLTEVYSSAKPSASGLAAEESEKGLGPYTLLQGHWPTDLQKRSTSPKFQHPLREAS